MEMRVPTRHLGHSLGWLAMSAAPKMRQSVGWGNRAERGVASNRRQRASFSARWQLASKP